MCIPHEKSNGMTDSYKDFIRILKRNTIGAGITVDQVAEDMQVSRSSVYGWFRYRSIMNGEAVVKEARLYIGGTI